MDQHCRLTMMMKLCLHHYYLAEVPMFQQHHSLRALLLDFGSDNSMPNCKPSELLLLSTDSPTLGQLFEATFSCHSVLAEPNLPSSVLCLVVSCQQISFQSKAPKEQLQSCKHRSLQSSGLLISYRPHSVKQHIENEFGMAKEENIYIIYIRQLLRTR